MESLIFNDGIMNQNFIEKLNKDITKYDILYICAPFGWGFDFTEGKIIQISKSGKNVIVVHGLEKITENDGREKVWNLLKEKKKNDAILFISSKPIPEHLLPYTIQYKFISYGINDIKPSNEDVISYFNSKGISLPKDDFERIEKDCHNFPLYIQLLANLLGNTNSGYRRSVREQCVEDLWTYIDVMFFRRFNRDDQNAMLKLSCLEQFDLKLISYMLDISRKEAENLVERLLLKGSVLEKYGSGWKFQPLIKQFLERAIQKYLDYEERLEEYTKAMNYLMGKKKWFPAIRFAYILQDKEQMAVCLNHLVSEYIDYNDFVSLENYFRELSMDVLMRYPTLMIAGSILKATIGDQVASRRYEKLYFQLIDQVEDEIRRKNLYVQLLFMYMSRPGMIRDDILEISTELLESIGDDGVFEENGIFEPHYISVLRGEKDYCKYFHPEKEESVLEKLHEVADKMNERTFSIMLQFMEAEVHYERNELDKALDALVKASRAAKYDGNERMQQLCMIAIADLQASRNQMNNMEVFSFLDSKTEGKHTPLFIANCQAHEVYYHLLKNNTEVIQQWMREFAPDENERFYTTYYYQYLIKAKVYIWMGQYVKARIILQILMDYAEGYRMAYLEAQVRILEAVIYYREGSLLWKETLLPAIRWAKELGFIRIFADEGAAVYEILNRLSQEEKDWEKDEYFKKVLSASKAHMLQYPKYLKQEEKGEIGEFSNSEKSVMSLLVLGEKNAEIAERLCVSENTVKYHLKNIYQKLQVKSRSQAIHKIREYNII